MHALGLTDDEVTTPSEARRMRYYDPAVDDDVPPEPFADPQDGSYQGHA